MSASTFNEFVIIPPGEEVFLYINYLQPTYEQSSYIKICLSEDDKFSSILLKNKISVAIPGINIVNCNFFWKKVPIVEEDLIPLIKAKAGCGNFELNLKDKLDTSRKIILPNNIQIQLRNPVVIPSSITSPNPNEVVERLASNNIQVCLRSPVPVEVPAATPSPKHKEPESLVILDDSDETNSVSETSSSHETAAEGITSAKFLAYVNSNRQTKRLLLNDHLEPSVRKSIVSCAADFLYKECGETQSISDRNAMVKVVVDVFRGLELQEQFVTKWLHGKMKNNRRKTRMESSSKRKKTDEDADIDVEDFDETVLDKIQFLKECKDPGDIQRIKIALKDTLKFRIEQQYTNPNFSVFDSYRFLAKSSDLIYYEFDNRFPNAADDVPLNLELFMDAAFNIFRAETKLPVPEEDCIPPIQKLLCICHFLKTSKGPMKQLSTLNEMLDNMVVFLTEDDDQKPEFRVYPLLIAQGPTRSEINKYFLQIEDVLLDLPEQIEFVQAFDFLMRSYYVFNVAFPKILTVFFNFIMLNVYDVKEKSKIDLKKPQIEDTLLKPREFLRKVLKCINDMK